VSLEKEELSSSISIQTIQIDVAALERVLASHSIHVRYTKIRAEDLVTATVPVIARLWGNEFRIIEAADAPGSIKSILPPGQPKINKMEEFKLYYSGFALFFSKDSMALPKTEGVGPDIRFDDYEWDFGRIDEGALVRHSFTFRNAGNSDLVITAVDTSCGDCLLSESGSQIVSAGGRGEIKGSFNSINQRREQSQTLRVRSNDPITPVVPLTVGGYILSARLIVSPESIDFGAPRRGETMTRDILVPLFPEESIVVTSASSDSPYVTVSISKSNYPSLLGSIVTARLEPRAPIGELKGTINIVSNHPKQPKTGIPFTANVRGRLNIDRDLLFFGIVAKGHEQKTTSRLSVYGETPIRIRSADSSLKYVSVKVIPKTEGKEYILTATLSSDAPQGEVAGRVTLHTDDPEQPEISVPLCGYVEKSAQEGISQDKS